MTLTLTPNQERLIKALAEKRQKPVEVVLDDFLMEKHLTLQETQDEKLISMSENGEYHNVPFGTLWA